MTAARVGTAEPERNGMRGGQTCASRTAPKPAAHWPTGWRRSSGTTPWCWPCHAAACRWRCRSACAWGRRGGGSSHARSGFPDTRSSGSVRAAEPRRLVLAVPVCANDSRLRLGGVADWVVCLFAPDDLGSVGRWYDDFQQVTDEEVVDLLAVARASRRLSELSTTRSSGGE